MKMTEGNSSGKLEITMDDVKVLIKKKDEIEEQIKAYYDMLEDVSEHSVTALAGSEVVRLTSVSAFSLFHSRVLVFLNLWWMKKVIPELTSIYTKSGQRDTAFRVSLQHVDGVVFLLWQQLTRDAASHLRSKIIIKMGLIN